MICHNDVCPENVVFRGGSAVVLLDLLTARSVQVVEHGGRLEHLAVRAQLLEFLDTVPDADLDPLGGREPIRSMMLNAATASSARTPACRAAAMAASALWRLCSPS